MIEVRKAVPDDAEALGEVHAASWQAAYAPFFDPAFAAGAVRAKRTAWHERIAREAGRVLLAAAAGRPLAVAFAVPSPTGPGTAEIFSFYCHPDGWGTGIAARLMAGTLAQLRDDRYARVHLWTLRDTPQSRRFYAKCGFTETGARRDLDFGDGRPLPQVEYRRDC